MRTSAGSFGAPSSCWAPPASPPSQTPSELVAIELGARAGGRVLPPLPSSTSFPDFVGPPGMRLWFCAGSILATSSSFWEPPTSPPCPAVLDLGAMELGFWAGGRVSPPLPSSTSYPGLVREPGMRLWACAFSSCNAVGAGAVSPLPSFSSWPGIEELLTRSDASLSMRRAHISPPHFLYMYNK
ncbi:unnamed protein product [Ectocarpus sp. 12 AP-2014]